jgi:non-specific serine/threonine protein kinase
LARGAHAATTIEEGLVITANAETAETAETPLSPREREVADLIGEGLTNAEIALRLVISRRTVETHVDHIKSKLGFARRARIVAWALERR